MSKKNPCMITRAIPDANITVSIMGLAVSNYNQSNKNWETIFLRDIASHELKITVNKCRKGVLVADGQMVFEKISLDERFFIRANKVTNLGAPAILTGEQSLENVLDLTGPELYQSSPDIFEANSNRPLTFLSIADSIFYAQSIPDEEYEIKIGSQTTDKKRTADVTGSDIKCDVGGTLEILTILQPNLIPSVVIEPDTSYEIIFDNTCNNPPSANEGTDFVHYNSLFKSDIEKSSVSFLGDGTKTGACHRCIATDLGSFDSLSQLLRPFSS
jgi:hypothetical protein